MKWDELEKREDISELLDVVNTSLKAGQEDFANVALVRLGELAKEKALSTDKEQDLSPKTRKKSVRRLKVVPIKIKRAKVNDTPKHLPNKLGNTTAAPEKSTSFLRRPWAPTCST